MNREKIKKFLADPTVRESLKKGNIEQVALMASSVGNLAKDPDLRELSVRLMKSSRAK